jgi:hypothetical protein
MGAEEGRAAGLDDALDRRAALRARLAFPVINPEVMLEIAEFAIGMSVIAQ